MIGGTNGASWQYDEIIANFRSKNYCTLNFDHRSHGRSEDAPGELTAELLAEDAASLIKHVFKGKPVHILGWSLGGAITYYLELHYPDLVKTATLSGMTSCFGGVLADGECNMGFDPVKWFFSRDLILRLLGTDLQGAAAVSAIEMQDNPTNRGYFRQLKTSTMTRTPQTWGRWNRSQYHAGITDIQVPTLLVAGEYEHHIGFDEASMSEDVRRIRENGGTAEHHIFSGFSHFIFFETRGDGVRGLDVVMDAINTFHAKHV